MDARDMNNVLSENHIRCFTISKVFNIYKFNKKSLKRTLFDFT